MCIRDRTLGEQLNVPVYEKGTSQSAESIVEEAMRFARENNNDVIIIDTAGRLHIDEPVSYTHLDVYKRQDCRYGTK